MVTTAIDPEKPVSDDHHKNPAKRGGHRDDGHEEEILQVDSDEQRRLHQLEASPEGSGPEGTSTRWRP